MYERENVWCFISPRDLLPSIIIVIIINTIVIIINYFFVIIIIFFLIINTVLLFKDSKVKTENTDQRL